MHSEIHLFHFYFIDPHTLPLVKSILGVFNATNHQLISYLVSVGLNKAAATGFLPFPPPGGLVAIFLMCFLSDFSVAEEIY